MRRSPKEAKQLLQRFPGIAEPGADKILLFAGGQVSLTLEFRGGVTAAVAWTSAAPRGDGLDLMVAETTGPGADDLPGPAPRKAFAADELPHLVSTRDTRDRLDLVTENVPVSARAIRADRIIYHPGDTAAAHYHTDCHHVFCVLSGSGLLYTEEGPERLEAGDSVLVDPGEVHWFENDTGENFSFVEFWAPPPTETIWTVAGDRCTWAPAG